MFISSISLRNWRNFTSLDLDLQERVFLVGPNGSGKSNLIDAFRFLNDLVIQGGGFLYAVDKVRGGVSSLRSLAARKHSELEVAVKVTEEKTHKKWTYALRFSQDNNRRPIIKNETIECNDDVILKRPNKEDEKDAALLTQTHLEQINANQRFREIYNFFQDIRYIHLVPQIIRHPDRMMFMRDDPYGSDFLAQIGKLSEATRNTRLKRIEKSLRKAIPNLKNFEFDRDERGHPHLKAQCENWRPNAGWQYEKDFSDGTLRLIGILWGLFEKSAVLLLEEPEISLHPFIVKQIPPIIAKIQSYSKYRKQIIVSTHSSDLLSDEGIGLDEVVLLMPAKEKTEVELASSLEEAEILLNNGSLLSEVVIPKTARHDAFTLTLEFPE